MNREKTAFFEIAERLQRTLHRVWSNIIKVKAKVTYKMYQKEKEKNAYIGAKLKENSSKIDEHKERVHKLYDEINSKNRTIARLEEQNRKITHKLKLVSEENEKLKLEIENFKKDEII